MPAEARLLREEIFAPVLAITTVRSEDEAVRSANNTGYGLVAYAYTRYLDRAHRLIRTLDAGMLGVNTGPVSDTCTPFGGVKQSGLGRGGIPRGDQQIPGDAVRAHRWLNRRGRRGGDRLPPEILSQASGVESLAP